MPVARKSSAKAVLVQASILLCLVCAAGGAVAYFWGHHRSLAGWLYLVAFVGLTATMFVDEVVGSGRDFDLERLILSLICGWLFGFGLALVAAVPMTYVFHAPQGAVFVTGGAIALLFGPGVVTAMYTDDSPGSDVGPD